MSLAFVATRLCQQVNNCHTNGNTIFNLIENNALVAVGNIAGDFDSTIDGPGVHHHDFFREAIQKFFVQAILHAVFALSLITIRRFRPTYSVSNSRSMCS